MINKNKKMHSFSLLAKKGKLKPKVNDFYLISKK